MIIEGLLTTTDPDGRPRLAPMGPEVDSVPFDRLLLKPFVGSQSGRNLHDQRRGVFHATDDVLLLARAAVGAVEDPPTDGDGLLLADYCWAVEFDVIEIDDSCERWRLWGVVTRRHEGRPWSGFNRGQFAVVEAAILATRIGMLPTTTITSEFDRLASLVGKTGGRSELAAFELLRDFVTRETTP